MSENRSIALGIDPSGAEAGGRVVKRNLDEIGDKAVQTEVNVNKVNKALNGFGATANDNIRKIANTIGLTDSALSDLGGTAGIASLVFSKLGAVILGATAALLGFVGASLALKQFIDNTIESQQVQTQLATVLKSTGNAAGQTLDSLNAMATSLQDLTNFEDDAIGKSQALLLTFTKIGGDTFPKAQKAILDLATAMGGDLQGATIQIGKALNDPIQGVAALGRVGVSFSAVQKEMITNFVNSNQLAKAQAVVLAELTKEFGGSAEAARTKLGGALTSLNNAWGNLFELSTDATESLRLAIEKLIVAIKDPGFQTFITTIGVTLLAALEALVALATLVVNGISAIVDNLDVLGVALGTAAGLFTIVFGAAILDSVAALTVAIGVGLLNAIYAVDTAMVAFALTNPFTAIYIAIVGLVTAVYYFRDEIKKAWGIDVVEIAKTVGNTIINSFRAAFIDLTFLSGNFKDIMKAAWVGIQNIIIDSLNEIILTFKGAVQTLIDIANMVPGVSVGNLDLTTPPIEGVTGDKDMMERLQKAVADRNKAIKDVMASDPLGDLVKTIEGGNKPADAPGVPGAKDTAAANAEVSESYAKITKSAQDSIREMEAMTKQLQLTGYAAKEFGYQQDLINKAMAEGIILTPKQRAELEALGTQMAKINSLNEATKTLQSQNSDIQRLQLEHSLVSATTADRERSLAVFDAEQDMVQKGIDLNTTYAQKIKDNAAAISQLKLENERATAAFSAIQQAGGTMIDQLVSGMTTVGSSWKDTFKNMLSTALGVFNQLAIANPLKNALTGTNLPTIADLFSKGTSALTGQTTSTASMAVTAGVVNVSGAIPGLGSVLPGLGATAVVPGAAAATTPGLGASATVNLAGAVANAGTTKTGTPLSDISVNGQTAQVNSQYAGNFQGFLNELQGRGYNVNSLGGYDYRTIAGTDRLSNHAFGNAIDINPAQNPVTYPGKGQSVITDLPPDVQSMAAKYGLEQGMWKSKSDPMHFEVAKGQPGMDQATQSLQKLSNSSNDVATKMSAVAPAADDASKALSTGNSSLTSSVTDATKSLSGAGASGIGGAATGSSGGLLSGITGLLGNLTKGIGSMFTSLFSGIGSIFQSIFSAFGDGAAFSGGRVTAFATGGIVSKPTMFPMSNGLGLMGERGPEAIMPLMRGPNGRLGVSLHNGSPAQQTSSGPSAVHYTIQSNITVAGNGDKELQERLHKSVQDDIKNWGDTFSRDHLPTRIREVNNDRWARG